MSKMVRPSDLIPTAALSDGETIPLLSDAEYAALRDSIKALGILQPVLVSWPDKHIIDGHHRVRAALDLEMYEIPVTLDEAHTPDQQEEIGLQLNSSRRHWPLEMRERAIRRRLKKTPHRSSRDIASTLCVDHKTVEKNRKEMEATGEIPTFDFRTDKRGSSRKSGGHKGGLVRRDVPTGQGIARPPKVSGAEQEAPEAHPVVASTDDASTDTPPSVPSGVGAPTGAPALPNELPIPATIDTSAEPVASPYTAPTANPVAQQGSTETVDLLPARDAQDGELAPSLDPAVVVGVVVPAWVGVALSLPRIAPLSNAEAAALNETACAHLDSVWVAIKQAVARSRAVRQSTNKSEAA